MDSSIENANNEANKPSFFSRIKNMSRENMFLFGIMGITIGMIAGLTTGIVLSQNDRASLGSYRRAIDILESYPLVDGHNDYSWKLRVNFKNQFDQFDFKDMNPYRQFMSSSSGISHTDIKRIREGRLGAQFWAVYTNCNSIYKDALRIHLEQVDALKRLINKNSDDMEFVTTADGIMKAFENGKVASLLGLESGHAIDSSLAALRVFYRLGVRYMTLTHNCDLPWATSHYADRAIIPNEKGLSLFGQKVIAEMNRLGMMIDLSHVSYLTMINALDISKAPVIFSHSSVFSICNSTRNVRDDILLRLKENNGIIMINFYTQFLNCESDWRKTTIEKVIEHINYVKNLIGVDHIGLGSDFDGVDNTPIKIDDVAQFPALITALIDDGWKELDIIKITYRNLNRVLHDVELVAKNQTLIPPYEDLLDYNDQPVKTCYTRFD